MSRSDDRLLVDDSSFTNDYMNSLSKARRDIIEDCMIVLGYPVITLYITQYQIDKLIDFATRKCESKVSMPHLALINVGNGVVDVSKYDVEAVRQIYEGNFVGSSSCAKLEIDPNSDGGGGNLGLSPCNVCDQLCQYRGYTMMDSPDSRKMLYEYIAYNMARSEMRNLILTDWYLDPTSNKLYIDGFSGLVTMEYVKAHSTFEEIARESYWRQWIRDYTLAMVKITEGRIRSKYKISSGVFEIESDELINEGNNDKQELEQKLTDGDFGYWNIMRG
jgi:hypothetical protein